VYYISKAPTTKADDEIELSQLMDVIQVEPISPAQINDSFFVYCGLHDA